MENDIWKIFSSSFTYLPLFLNPVICVICGLTDGYQCGFGVSVAQHKVEF